jgi:hypothetical protein
LEGVTTNLGKKERKRRKRKRKKRAAGNCPFDNQVLLI